MMMRRWAVLTAMLVAAASFAQAWGEPLPSDPRNQTGKLPNGVTWIYRQHDNPPGKMALYVTVNTGSLNEKDSQRGLAHFMEHMCFNGTEHYAPGTLIKYFESIGMEFGADVNASTSFEATTYKLFTPDTESDTVDKAIMTLSDYVFRAQLLAEEIDKERNVVMEEWRRGQGPGQRIQDQLFENVFSGTRFAARLPIGKPEIIEKAGRDEFVDYYRNWYRPERITVILVGDAPATDYIPSIEKWFGQYKAETPAQEEHTPGFKKFAEKRAFVFKDTEFEGCQVQLIDVGDTRGPTTTKEQYRNELIEQVGSWIVNRRLQERVQKGEASYRGASVAVFSFFNDAVLRFASAFGEPEDWAKMLEEVTVEVSRACEHGFTDHELEMARKEILAGAEHAVQTEPSVNARRLIGQITRKVTSEEPILSAQQDLDLVKGLLPAISLSEVDATFKSNFDGKNFAFVVTLPDKPEVTVPPSDDVLAAANAAFSRTTKPVEESKAPDTILASEPKPGKIVDTSFDEDLKITSVWLDNGVRVHHRFMDYKKDTVMVGITLAGGEIQENEDNLSVTSAATAALGRQPATSRLTSTNVRDLMTGKNISVRAFSGSDVVGVNISGAPEDLEAGLQLVYAVLTDGKIEQSALDNWKKGMLEQRKQLQTRPEFKAAEALAEELGGGDPRLRAIPSEKNINAIELDKTQKWIDRIFRTAPIEVAVVGEIEKDKALELVQKYIGSLPKRERKADNLDKLRTLPRSTGPYNRHVDVPTITERSMAIAGFLSCEAKNIQDSRAMEIASKVLSSRLVDQVRENLSLVYSIRAMSSPSRVYRDSGQFLAQAPCKPGNADEVVKEAHKLFAAFAESGPTDVELANAKKQIENNLDEYMKEPHYWFGVLNDLDYRGKSLEDEKAEPTAYKPFTSEQVAAVFRRYYKPERMITITAEPAATATPKESKEKEMAVEPTQ